MLGEGNGRITDFYPFFGADESASACSSTNTKLSSKFLKSSPAGLARALSDRVRLKSTHSSPSGKREPGRGG